MAQAAAHERKPVQNRTQSFLLMCSRMRYEVAVVFAGSVSGCHENSNRLVAGAGKVAGKQRQQQEQCFSNPGASFAIRLG